MALQNSTTHASKANACRFHHETMEDLQKECGTSVGWRGLREQDSFSSTRCHLCHQKRSERGRGIGSFDRILVEDVKVCALMQGMHWKPWLGPGGMRDGAKKRICCACRQGGHGHETLSMSNSAVVLESLSLHFNCGLTHRIWRIQVISIDAC